MWIKENEPIWDGDKERIFIGTEPGCFNFNPNAMVLNNRLSDHWWKLQSHDGRVIGYGWINEEKNDAEVSVVVSKEEKCNSKHYGTNILLNLENEAKGIGYNEVIAIVQPENPNASRVIHWLFNNGYVAYGINNQKLSYESACNWIRRIPITMIKSII